MHPRKYDKVKLKTASGGSLTIRYRRTSDLAAVECSSSASGGSNGSETAEASVTSLGTDQSQTSTSLHMAATMSDQNHTLDGLTDATEVTVSVSEVINIDPRNVSADDNVESSVPSPHYFSSPGQSPDCNSSYIGQSDHHTEPQPAAQQRSFGMPAAVPLLSLSEKFMKDTESSELWSDFPEIQQFSFENDTLSSHQLMFSNAEGVEVSSSDTVHSVEDYEQFGACFWSSSSRETIIVEETQMPLMDNSHMSILCFPSIFTDTLVASSTVDLQDFPPFLQYIDTAGSQEPSLLHLDSNLFDNNSTGCLEEISLDEDAELFDDNKFLLLDPVMPDKVDLEDFGILQTIPSSVPQDQISMRTPNTHVVDLSGRVCVVAKEDPAHLSSASGLAPSMENSANISLARPTEMVHASRSSFSSFRQVGTRGKNVRKRRLRRATPLNTVKSLLSRKEIVSGDETNHYLTDGVNLSGSRVNVFSRKTAKKKPEVTVCVPGNESSLIWRYHSADEIHNYNHQVLQMHEQTYCTNSRQEDDTQGARRSQQVNGVSSQRERTKLTVDHVRNRRQDGPARRPPRYGSLLPEHAVSTLRKWFDDHISFPFADKEQKLDLVSKTGLTLTQVDNWLSNYRHRLKVRKSDFVGKVFRPEKAWTSA